MQLTRVLVVDDDSATRSGLSELLTWRATRLSGYNGLQLVFRFRELPAIVMTGYADPVFERDAGQAGATYIRKPLNVNELLDLVREKLRRVRRS
jgi:FixJ family two-component response regulator